MEKDGMNTTGIKRNAGEDELTLSMADAFDKLEKEGGLPEIVEKPAEVEKPADVSDTTGRKVPQKAEEPKDEPPAVQEPEPEPEPEIEVEDDPSYELDDLHNLAKDENEPKKPEHSRADDEDSKAEIEEIRQNPHTPEKTKKGIDRLLGNNNRLKKFLEEERSKVSVLQAEVEKLKSAKPTESPLSEQDRHELNMLRMKHNIGKDENIKKNYDEPISATEHKIYSIVDRSLPNDQAKQVRDMGFENFARRFPSAYRELLNNLQENNPLDASILSASVNDLLTLRSSREAEVEKMVSQADEYFSNQEKNVNSAIERRKADLDALKKKTFNELIATNPLYMEIPTKDLAGEDLKLAETENRMRAIYRQKAQEFIDVNSVEGQQKLISYAVLSLPLSQRVKQLTARIKQLEANKKAVADARSLKKGKENPAPKEEAPVQPASFGEALDIAANRQPTGILSPTRSIPR